MTEQILIPIIKCLPREDFLGGMKFWCPYCEKWHYHGLSDGHRCAHCGSGSPFYPCGYIVKMMSKAELKEIRRAINEYLGSADQ